MHAVRVRGVLRGDGVRRRVIGAKHTHFKSGQRVRVKLRNGDVLDDHFFERHSRYVVLKRYGRIRTSELQSMTIWRTYG